MIKELFGDNQIIVQFTTSYQMGLDAACSLDHFSWDLSFIQIYGGIYAFFENVSFYLLVSESTHMNLDGCLLLLTFTRTEQHLTFLLF